MHYSIILVINLAAVMFAKCSPIDSEIEMLEWLDNPNAYQRDFNQETEEREWLDDAFAHFYDVRHVNYPLMMNQEELRSQMKDMEQYTAMKENEPHRHRYRIPPVEMPLKEQKPEQVSQEGQKFEQDAMEQMNPEQFPADGKYSEQATYGYSRPTPPASIQVETKPEEIPVVENKADEIPVVLEQDQATERYRQPIFVEEQKAEQVPVKQTKPEDVLEVPEQVSVDVPQPVQVPVVETKPEQIPVDAPQPWQVPLVAEKPEQLPVDEPMQVPAVETEPEQVLVEQKKPGDVPVVPEQVPVNIPPQVQVPVVESKPEQVPVDVAPPVLIPIMEEKPKPIDESQQVQIPVLVETKPDPVPVAETKPVEFPVAEKVPVEQKRPEQVLNEKPNLENPSVLIGQNKPELVPVGTETPGTAQVVDPVKKQVPSDVLTVPVHTHKPNGPIDFAESGCFWSGTAPFCRGRCGTFYRAKIINKTGDGKTCLTGNKKLCCPIPSNQLKSLMDLR
ncbi:hypothetical protein GHT06_011819 [Daphnia sinensis]|uniref:Clip domain-containing protein n=1 Tax=Daphnia sinensis TaxID=1820382 RepID=A0AAD5PZA8_9CRUS|nr:hypothetical protein GHT06_011819 [Daphnia sinensis]